MQVVNKLTMFYMAVNDMPKAKEFYADKLGLKVMTDYRQDDKNWWVSLTPPEGGVTITLSTFHGNTKPGTMNLYFATSDVAAAHRELSDKRLRVDEVKDDLYGPGSGVKWFRLNDPDGNQVTLAQAKAMKDQFFTDYLELLQNLQHRLHKEVLELPVEVMDWSPGPEMNSVAVLLAHITGVLHEGIDLGLGDLPSRVRKQEFQTRGVPSVEMLRRLDAVIDYARDALPRLGLEDLDQKREDEDGTVTCGWVLLHALEHAYLHLGHLQLTCQMWRQSVKTP